MTPDVASIEGMNTWLASDIIVHHAGGHPYLFFAKENKLGDTKSILHATAMIANVTSVESMYRAVAPEALRSNLYAKLAGSQGAKLSAKPLRVIERGRRTAPTREQPQRRPYVPRSGLQIMVHFAVS